MNATFISPLYQISPLELFVGRCHLRRGGRYWVFFCLEQLEHVSASIPNANGGSVQRRAWQIPACMYQV